MNTVIGTGKTIEQAIENALTKLNATQDQVTIRVISEGGFFKKAQVEVTLDEVEKKAPIVTFDEFDENEKINKNDEIKIINKKGLKEPVVDVQVNIEEPKVTVSKNGKTTKVSETKVDVKVDVKVNKSGVDDKTAEKVLNQIILKTLEFSKTENANLTFEFDDRTIYVKIDGEKLGGLIGANGDTLNAFECYINAASLKQGITKRVRIDVGGYKKEKENKLISLAEKAYQIAQNRGSYKFDPMTARERRIIHSALQNKPDVTTFSKGTEPKRFVIVEKK